MKNETIMYNWKTKSDFTFEISKKFHEHVKMSIEGNDGYISIDNLLSIVIFKYCRNQPSISDTENVKFRPRIVSNGGLEALRSKASLESIN